MVDGSNSDNDFFTDLRVAVVGLGLMGGSLALGLRGRCREILAVEPDPCARDLALRQGIVSAISADPAEILPKAGLVILAAPVGAILDLIPRLPDLQPGGAVVIDLGSTKTLICQALEELPGGFEAVGGHPMCGKAVAGLQYADATLFQGAPFAFTTLSNTSDRAFQVAQHLAVLLGAHPVWTGPNTHDGWVAATSHLPYLLASALALATPAEAAQLVGPGFHSATRLAGSPSSVMLPILETNPVHVLAAIARFRQELAQLEDLLRRGDLAQLQARLDQAAGTQAALTGRS
jgi:prephenate dehydrogenase